jgi:F0F1-type ATP synthase membrane subunit b/b'
MDETLKQLGELLLSSIPAIFGLLIVWTAYRLIVYSRLQQVLAERQALTEGAVEQAQKDIAVAEDRTADYERQLREARAQVFMSQEAHSRRAAEGRTAALAESRKNAEAMIKEARAALEKETLAAKAALQQQADGLANEIISSVLKQAVAAGGR